MATLAIWHSRISELIKYMTETLKKKIVAILVWVLIILPLHVAMGSVSVSDRDDQSMQSMESSTPHQLSGVHHSDNTRDLDKNNSGGHCKQDTGCNGCDACSHCINIISSVTLFDVQALHNLFSSPSITLYQTDNSATFRPPKHS